MISEPAAITIAMAATVVASITSKSRSTPAYRRRLQHVLRSPGRRARHVLRHSRRPLMPNLRPKGG